MRITTMSENTQKVLQEKDLFSPNLHNILFDGSSYLLGKIHYRILYAERTINKLSYKKPEKEFSVPLRTEFGNEVDHDEISWWIKKKESSVPELLKKTKNTLEKIDNLKHASDKIIHGKDEEYLKVIEAIKDFTNLHADAISILYDYVEWLNSKDSLAPCILFNYRTWNSTPMNDRRITIDISKKEPTEMELKICTETACGFRNIFGYTAIDGIDIEAFSEGVSFTSENLSIFRLRISHEIRRHFYEFIVKIRTALQHIELEAEKIQRAIDLLNAKLFWSKNISKIMNLSVEDTYYDFKKSLEIWHNHKDPDKAKFEFCEDIAALANSSGGVLIIGVSDEKPRRIFHIDDLESRVKFTKQLILDKIRYDRDFTHFIQFTVNDEGIDKDCLVIGVEQTKKAVSVTSPDKTISWPKRIQTGKDRREEDDINQSKQNIPSDNVNFMLRLEKDISE